MILFQISVVIATGEPYGCGQKTEMIDFLKLNQGNERLLNTPRCYGCSGELIQVKFILVFWEGHQIFDWQYIGQIIGGDFAKFCGLLRIYEHYE